MQQRATNTTTLKRIRQATWNVVSVFRELRILPVATVGAEEAIEVLSAVCVSLPCLAFLPRFAQ